LAELNSERDLATKFVTQFFDVIPAELNCSAPLPAACMIAGDHMQVVIRLTLKSTKSVSSVV